MNALIFCAVLLSADVDTFLDQINEQRADIQSLKASFTHTAKSADRTETSEGQLVYVRPRRLVAHYGNPPMTTLIDDLTYYEYDSELDQVEVITFEEGAETEALFLGFESNMTRLKEAFDVSLFDPEGVPGAVKGLLLKPKPDKAEEMMIQELRLYLRDKDFLPVRIEWSDADESSVQVDVKDIQVNPTIKPEETQLFAPPDTVIMRDDVLVETTGPDGKRMPAPKLVSPPLAPLPEPKTTGETPK